jgi:hypothetical protein
MPPVISWQKQLQPSVSSIGSPTTRRSWTKLAYLKAVVRLTPDQNEVWEAFEKTVHRMARAHRMDDMRQMLENHERKSSTDCMDAMARHMARRADELKESSEPSKRHCHAATNLRSFWSPGSQWDEEDQLRWIPVPAGDH